MFDIGFAELLIIGVVGLLVIGPERLPGAIRTGSAWLNRFRRSFNDIKQEVQQELHNDAVLRDLRESGEKLRRETESLQRDLAGTDDSGKAAGNGRRHAGDDEQDKKEQDGAPTAADQSAGHRETPAPFMRSNPESDTATPTADGVQPDDRKDDVKRDVDNYAASGVESGAESGIEQSRDKDVHASTDAAEGHGSDDAGPATGHKS